MSDIADETTIPPPRSLAGRGVKAPRDMATASTVDEVVELRKQETRRRITYTFVYTLCFASLYLVGFGGEKAQLFAYGGLLSIGSGLSAFYFGSRMQANS